MRAGRTGRARPVFRHVFTTRSRPGREQRPEQMQSFERCLMRISTAPAMAERLRSRSGARSTSPTSSSRWCGSDPRRAARGDAAVPLRGRALAGDENPRGSLSCRSRAATTFTLPKRTRVDAVSERTPRFSRHTDRADGLPRSREADLPGARGAYGWWRQDRGNEQIARTAQVLQLLRTVRTPSVERLREAAPLGRRRQGRRRAGPRPGWPAPEQAEGQAW